MKAINKMMTMHSKEMNEEETVKFNVAADNQKQGDLIGYDCEKCLNRGYYDKAELIGDKWRAIVYDCECKKIRIVQKRLDRLGLDFKKLSFDNYIAKEDWQKHIKEKALEFTKEKGKWLYIGGQVGCGKTHIATATFAKLIEKGLSGEYMLWREMVVKLKSQINEPSFQIVMNKLVNTDVLYIDDFLKTIKGEMPSDAELRIAYDIINDRYNKKKTTIISCEKHLKKLYDIEESIHGRIKEMSKGYDLNVAFVTARNMRLKEEII